MKHVLETASWPTPSALLASWGPAGVGTAHQRLATVIAALVDDPDMDNDTLGDRNRRLLQLHADCVQEPLEACVRCKKCGVDSEFAVPSQEILALPRHDREQRFELRSKRKRTVFRLPTMADLDAAVGATSPAEVRRIVLGRCVLEGDATRISELDARRLSARFDAADQAADVVVNVMCAGCGARISATVDVAAFVARAIERLVSRLLSEIDLIASSYGWSESQILSLPAWRRRRYVEHIQAARAPSRAIPALGSP